MCVCVCVCCRYLLEDWSGAVLALLRPVSTRSASSRHQATEVSEPQWDGRTVLIKVRGWRGGGWWRVSERTEVPAVVEGHV